MASSFTDDQIIAEDRAPQSSGWQWNWLPRQKDALPLLLYAAGFALTHALAAWWGGIGFYSLWYPAAGLRLALRWRGGAQLSLAAAVIELAVDLVTGAVSVSTHDWPIAMFGAVRPHWRMT